MARRRCLEGFAHLNRGQSISQFEEIIMDLSSISTPNLADRIAILRDNIRQITERAAAESGAADEERNANLLARQTEELDALLAEQQKRLAK
jgi:hypothetical protein